MTKLKTETKGKRVAPWVQANIQDWLTENFKTLNAGAVYAITSFPPLYRQTLIGMKGKFSEGELKLMLDIMNGTTLNSDWPGATIIGNVIDAIALDNIAEKFEIDGQKLKGKLENLHVFQLHILEIWANGFWYGGNPDKVLDIEARVRMLL